jgi:hypothetical protein
MITVAPSAEFETSIDWGVTGLTGTLRVSLLDGDGGTTTAATTTGIAEFPASSGRYEVTLTAPGTAGQYAVFWDDGSVTVGHTAAGDDVLVTSDGAAAVGGTDDLYVSRTELKTTMGISVTTYDDDIDLAITAASRAIDGYKQTRYYPTTETRYYDPPTGTALEIDDLNSLTSITADLTGDGTFETTWTNGTHFILEPENNALIGAPYRTVRLLPQSGAYWPSYLKSIKVIGSFGWAETPILVKAACKILAQRFYARKDSPLGVLAVGVEGAAVHLRKTDPDVAFMLDSVDSRPARLVA